jgi:hypothetical protein
MGPHVPADAPRTRWQWPFPIPERVCRFASTIFQSRAQSALPVLSRHQHCCHERPSTSRLPIVLTTPGRIDATRGFPTHQRLQVKYRSQRSTALSTWPGRPGEAAVCRLVRENAIGAGAVDGESGRWSLVVGRWSLVVVVGRWSWSLVVVVVENECEERAASRAGLPSPLACPARPGPALVSYLSDASFFRSV